MVSSLALTEWGIQNNCPKRDRVCYYTVEKQQLEVVKELYNNGYPWNKRSTYVAVLNVELFPQ